jgi:sugar phosphate isomerase/epimerase
METHGDLIQSEDIEKVITSVNRPNVGLVWDVVNMWSVTKEPPARVYARLKKYIRHTHIKDLVFVNDKPQYVLLGKGSTPVFEAIDLLAKDKYKGYFSFEWEKLWHPEIAEPEIAIANYARVMKEHFKN